jgi:hypothetical protein
VLGNVTVVATPGQQFRVSSSSGGAAHHWVPDEYDSDWGYGPYFHQTIRFGSGSWFQVPIPGISDSGWVDPSEWTREPDLLLVEGIITSPFGDLVVLGVAGDSLRARPEQPRDMWCADGAPPALQPWTEMRIPFSRLHDARGHLVVNRKYKRGC